MFSGWILESWEKCGDSYAGDSITFSSIKLPTAPPRTMAVSKVPCQKLNRRCFLVRWKGQIFCQKPRISHLWWAIKVFSPTLAKFFEVTLGMSGIILVSQQKCLSLGNHPSWAVQQRHNKSPSRLRPDPYKKAVQQRHNKSPSRLRPDPYKNGPWLSEHFQSSSPHLSKVKPKIFCCTSRIFQTSWTQWTHEEMIPKKKCRPFQRAPALGLQSGALGPGTSTISRSSRSRPTKRETKSAVPRTCHDWWVVEPGPSPLKNDGGITLW